MTDIDHHQKIIGELERLNAQIETQNSLRRVFILGIIYGLGFVVGSVVLATIGLGIAAPYFAEVPWVVKTYERGAALPR